MAVDSAGVYGSELGAPREWYRPRSVATGVRLMLFFASALNARTSVESTGVVAKSYGISLDTSLTVWRPSWRGYLGQVAKGVASRFRTTLD